jgi:hypothetical protein
VAAVEAAWACRLLLEGLVAQRERRPERIVLLELCANAMLSQHSQCNNNQNRTFTAPSLKQW